METAARPPTRPASPPPVHTEAAKRPTWSADRGTPFYRVAAVLGLLAVVVGFHLTYTRPVVTGAYEGPWWGHLHGALALAWVVLVIVQTQTATRRFAAHRALGRLALPVLLLWLASTVMIAREAALMMAASGDLATAQSNTIGGLASPVLVCVLVGLALYWRKRPQAHKRLMFVATVLMLWPAWARWRHYFPDPESLFNLFGFVVALAPIPLAMLRDRLRFGAVHPALLWGGLAAIGEQGLEVLLYETDAWKAASTAVYHLLT